MLPTVPAPLPGGPGLRVWVEPGPPGTAVLHLAGELDIATAPLLQDRLDELAAGPALAQLVVDLSELAFTDVVGLGALVRTQRAVAAGGGAVVLRGAAPLVQRVVELLGLTDRLPTEGRRA